MNIIYIYIWMCIYIYIYIYIYKSLGHTWHVIKTFIHYKVKCSVYFLGDFLRMKSVFTYLKLNFLRMNPFSLFSRCVSYLNNSFCLFIEIIFHANDTDFENMNSENIWMQISFTEMKFYFIIVYYFESAYVYRHLTMYHGLISDSFIIKI